MSPFNITSFEADEPGEGKKWLKTFNTLKFLILRILLFKIFGKTCTNGMEHPFFLLFLERILSFNFRS